jgi:hypothetical protein
LRIDGLARDFGFFDVRQHEKEIQPKEAPSLKHSSSNSF